MNFLGNMYVFLWDLQEADKIDERPQTSLGRVWSGVKYSSETVVRATASSSISRELFTTSPSYL